MRKTDLKPNTLYATCDGAMVMTTEDLNTDWYTRSVAKDGKWMVEWERAEKVNNDTDPWGGCRTGSQPTRRNNGWQGPGIRVFQYDFDAKGEKIADRKSEVLVRLKDIPGTWLQYMALHGEKVRERWEKRELAKTCDAMHKDLTGRLTAILGCDVTGKVKDGHNNHGLSVTVAQVFTFTDGTVSSWDNNKKRVKSMEPFPTVSLSGPAVERLLSLLEPKKRTRKTTTKNTEKKS